MTLSEAQYDGQCISTLLEFTKANEKDGGDRWRG